MFGKTLMFWVVMYYTSTVKKSTQHGHKVDAGDGLVLFSDIFHMLDFSVNTE